MTQANLYADIRRTVVEALKAVLPQTLDASVESRISVGPPRDPAHGDMVTNAAMIGATFARKPARELAAALVQHLTAAPGIAAAEAAGPGFVNLRLHPRDLPRPAAGHPRQRRSLRRRHHRRRQKNQHRVCLRQPHRPDAYRPLPRRRRRRRPRQPADQGRLHRHQGVLHQRRGRPGRRPRLGRLLALPPGHRHPPDRGRIRRRSPRRPAIQRRLPHPRRREL